MSTVPSDCIVSLPQEPLNSMRLAVGVSMGSGLILRNVGDYRHVYRNAQTLDLFIDIPASGNYQIPGGTEVFFLYTKGPVLVTASINDIDYTFPVNSLLILDSAYTSITVTNSSALNDVRVNMSYIPTVA